MKTVSSIYSKYKIMPSLQQHQLRVASAAKIICDSIPAPLNSKDVIITCLFHDMGNIIKFDLNYFPDFIEPKGLAYWQNIKDEYIKKYGHEEHEATEKICREIGLSAIQLNYLKAIGFSKTKKTVVGNSLEEKICCYCDQRAGPLGMLSIKERLIEGQKRYGEKKHKSLSSKQFAELAQALSELEKQIFSYTTIKSEFISDETVNSNISFLSSIKIEPVKR